MEYDNGNSGHHMIHLDKNTDVEGAFNFQPIPNNYERPKSQHDGFKNNGIRDGNPKHGYQNDNGSLPIYTEDDAPKLPKKLQEKNGNKDPEEEVYLVRQQKGYLSIGFSIVQTLVLLIMMIQCHIAPIQINPMLGPYPDALDYWGGKNAIKILDDGESWRLITPIFLHAGFIHLVCNVSVQLDTGAFYEREWGSKIWLIIYITSAIGSSILSCCYMPDQISVGSSGAVMGLFGGKLAEVFCRQRESQKTEQGRIARKVRTEQLSETLCAVTVVMIFGFVPYVDWAAHLGGLIYGFFSGMLCFSTWIKTRNYAIFWFVVGIILNVLGYSIALSYMYNSVDPIDDLNDVCEYYKRNFDEYECNCQLGDDGP
eukprot:CAMPEP_0184866270 /NCGR_PEP_ID=MMETSP0580-20130426/21612_1 /TAXON_ID=1118495 /ORGANISM="Dactyliosolen fragilissimus" /LENGTH=368 /DNA_ID=CAMNT_0027365861 /DNA_START=83 /DNA_END=1189 /DNA_ORIENTATION=+